MSVETETREAAIVANLVRELADRIVKITDDGLSNQVSRISSRI